MHRLIVIETAKSLPANVKPGKFNNADDLHLAALLKHAPREDDWGRGQYRVFYDPSKYAAGTGSPTP